MQQHNHQVGTLIMGLIINLEEVLGWPWKARGNHAPAGWMPAPRMRQVFAG
jgi:hypothetical protein